MFSNKLINRIKNAYYITIFTGSEFSLESGVPEFVENNGSWNNNDIKKLVKPETLDNNPELFWSYYKWYLSHLRNIKANLGHYALVDLERRYQGFSLITENIDNLHLIAGNKKVQELRGNINHIRCSECGNQYFAGQIDRDASVPTCPVCKGILRPDVILSGESFPSDLINNSREAAEICEIFISIGASNPIEPAASLPYIAKANGAFLIEVNKEKTELSNQVDELLVGDIASVLPQLIIQLEKVL